MLLVTYDTLNKAFNRRKLHQYAQGAVCICFLTLTVLVVSRYQVGLHLVSRSFHSPSNNFFEFEAGHHFPFCNCVAFKIALSYPTMLYLFMRSLGWKAHHYTCVHPLLEVETCCGHMIENCGFWFSHSYEFISICGNFWKAIVGAFPQNPLQVPFVLFCELSYLNRLRVIKNGLRVISGFRIDIHNGGKTKKHVLLAYWNLPSILLNFLHFLPQKGS